MTALGGIDFDVCANTSVTSARLQVWIAYDTVDYVGAHLWRQVSTIPGVVTHLAHSEQLPVVSPVGYQSSKMACFKMESPTNAKRLFTVASSA